jgi:hypothetical protein
MQHWRDVVANYNHNFLRFLPIFCEKNGVFLKNQCYDHVLQKEAVHSLSKKRHYFRQMFRRKYFQNRNIGPLEMFPPTSSNKFRPKRGSECTEAL